MNIQIRKLRQSESMSYREIRLQCLKHFPEYFSSNYQDEKRKHKLFFEPFIEQSDANNFVIGAFLENTLIGISGFERYNRAKTNHRGIILQVYVTPDYQRQNIGSSMIQSTLNEAFKINGIEQIEIGVIASNENAEKIYKKIGFQTYGIHKNYLKIDNLHYDHKMMMIHKNQHTRK